MKLKIYIFLFLFSVIFGLNACKKDNQPAQTDLTGTWTITGTLITTTNPDPSAPQPGYQAMDAWTVSLNAGVPRLTTSKGSIDGSAANNGVNDGYQWDGQYVVSPGLVWVVFEIAIFPSAHYNQIYGTEEFQYWSYDGYGNPIKIGIESWTITGVKQ